MYKHILLPTDGSDLSARSIPRAIELAKALGARVTGLCVVVETLVAAGIGKSLRDKDAPIAAAKEYLDVIAKEAARSGVPYECCYVVGTWAHEEIVKVAQNKGCDLIHMASRGKGMIEGLLLGSEADKVMVQSKVPVLIYR